MAAQMKTDAKMPFGLVALIAVQVVCVVFFLTDVAADFRAAAPGGNPLGYLHFEAVATLSLLAAIVVEVHFLLVLLRRKTRLEQSLHTATMAVYDVIEAHFEEWKLSPAETDVANFLVKGLEISEIAEMRGSAEGTIKAHLNAIYRKSGTHNRGELLSVLIDSLLGADA